MQILVGSSSNTQIDVLAKEVDKLEKMNRDVKFAMNNSKDWEEDNRCNENEGRRMGNI